MRASTMDDNEADAHLDVQFSEDFYLQRLRQILIEEIIK